MRIAEIITLIIIMTVDGFVIVPSGTLIIRRPNCQTNSINLESMSAWISRLDIKVSDVQIGNIGGLRGVIATDNFAPDNAIVTIPGSSVIETINNRPPSPFPDFCPQDLWTGSMWDDRLAYMLLYEKFVLGQSSSKIQWIQELPSSFSTPFYWEEEELSQLQYHELKNKIIEQRNEWQSSYSKWQRSASSNIVKTILFEEYIWALQCVNSRAFSGAFEGSTFQERKSLLFLTSLLAVVSPLLGLTSTEQAFSATLVVVASIVLRDLFSVRLASLKRYVISPYIDMFNHKSDAISDVSYNYFTGILELRTQPYLKGEQVYISYGKQSNDRFLQYYGFVEEYNPMDSYDFGVNVIELCIRNGDDLSSAGLLSATQPSPEVRLQRIADVLAKTPVQESSNPGRKSSTVKGLESKTKYSRAGGGTVLLKFDEVTVRTVRALVCTSSEWTALEAGNSALSLEALATPLSPATEDKILEVLRVFATNELASKPTTLADDLETRSTALSSSRDNYKELNTVDPSGVFSDSFVAALSFRIEKKRLLEEILS